MPALLRNLCFSVSLFSDSPLSATTKQPQVGGEMTQTPIRKKWKIVQNEATTVSQGQTPAFKPCLPATPAWPFSMRLALPSSAWAWVWCTFTRSTFFMLICLLDPHHVDQGAERGPERPRGPQVRVQDRRRHRPGLHKEPSGLHGQCEGTKLTFFIASYVYSYFSNDQTSHYVC